jgi:hypothetical protein
VVHFEQTWRKLYTVCILSAGITRPADKLFVPCLLLEIRIFSSTEWKGIFFPRRMPLESIASQVMREIRFLRLWCHFCGCCRNGVIERIQYFFYYISFPLIRFSLLYLPDFLSSCRLVFYLFSFFIYYFRLFSTLFSLFFLWLPYLPASFYCFPLLISASLSSSLSSFIYVSFCLPAYIRLTLIVYLWAHEVNIQSRWRLCGLGV